MVDVKGTKSRIRDCGCFLDREVGKLFQSFKLYAIVKLSRAIDPEKLPSKARR
jgi:hypothetical protein